VDTILVLDFGSQTSQLIARRIREIGVYSEIIPGDSALPDKPDDAVRGIIFSGSPYSVFEKNTPKPDPNVYNWSLPILGICYGLQRIVHDNGGSVESVSKKEYGRAAVTHEDNNSLFYGIPKTFISWMSHGDSITELPHNFSTVARSDNHPAAFFQADKKLYGLQFHPEVTHCEYGLNILENFAVRICGSEKKWNMDRYLVSARAEIRKKAGDRDILLLISGGVDSTVVAGLLLDSLPSNQVHLMYIDTGLMRKDESSEVHKNLRSLGAENLYLIDASERFLKALKGVENPEEKRKIIGDLFIQVQEDEIKDRGIQDSFLAQGTLYTDMIESGKGVGKKAHVIKSHHNVRSPLVEEKREKGLIIEPLSRLYKDEVRKLGTKVGIAEEIVNRHPFPGPGLGVRILGEVTEEKCDILREADHILISELKKRNLYNEIWQAFCVLLPIRSVGVAGDIRKYGWVVAIRAVISKDGMTADVYPFPSRDLLEISALITNTVPDVGRVVYDISSKPPATIEWE